MPIHVLAKVQDGAPVRIRRRTRTRLLAKLGDSSGKCRGVSRVVRMTEAKDGVSGHAGVAQSARKYPHVLGLV